MEHSTKDHATEETTEQMRAKLLVKIFKREARLRQIVEQSAFGFFMGETKLSTVLRICGLLVMLSVITVYMFSDSFSYTGLWPLIAIVAMFEAMRANRRLDAMVELELIAEQNYPDKSTQSADRSDSNM